MKVIFSILLILAFQIVGLSSYIIGSYFLDFENKYLAGALSFIIIPLIIGLIFSTIFNSWYQRFNSKASIHLFNPYFLTPIIVFWLFIMWSNKNGAKDFLTCYLYGSVYNNITLTEPPIFDLKGYISLKNVSVSKEYFGYYRDTYTTTKGSKTTSTKEYVVFPILPEKGNLNKVDYFAVHYYSNLNSLFDINEYDLPMISSNRVGGMVENHKYFIDFYNKATSDLTSKFNFTVNENPVYIILSEDSFDKFIKIKQKSFIIVLCTIQILYLILGLFTIRNIKKIS